MVGPTSVRLDLVDSNPVQKLPRTMLHVLIRVIRLSKAQSVADVSADRKAIKARLEQ
jgi:hypothetical protein